MTGGTAGLARSLTGRQLFLIAFGAAIGVGWIVVVGDWLRVAGPFGTVAGFAAGAAVLSLVCLCYGEMAAAFPVAGGEIAYTYQVWGQRPAFAVGWFLALAYTAICAFEAISIGWVASALFPGIEGPVLGVVNGSPVTVGGLILGVGGTLLLLWVNLRGIRSAARLQDWMTGALIVGSVGFIAFGLVGGDVANLRPYFQTNASGLMLPGILAIFLVTPNWLGGFAFIPQLMEERAPGSPPRQAVFAMVLQVLLAAAFYSLVAIAVAMAVPRETLQGSSLPVADAFRAAFGSELLVRLVLLTGLMGLITTWNAVFLGASRVLFALGRAHFIPREFARLDRSSGAPVVASLFVAGASLGGLLLGRSALLPLLNVVAAVQAAAFVVVAVGVLRLRRTQPALPRPFRVPGGAPVAVAAALGSVVAFYLALAEPFRAAGGRVPLEWWLFLGWGVVGGLFWLAARQIRRDLGDEERRAIILGRRAEETP